MRFHESQRGRSSLIGAFGCEPDGIPVLGLGPWGNCGSRGSRVQGLGFRVLGLGY